MSVVLFVLAACLMTAGQVLMTRANPGVRLPLWRVPPRDPTSAKVARGLAIGMALFGTINLDEGIAIWWGMAMMVAAVTAPLGLRRLLQGRREPAPRVR